MNLTKNFTLVEFTAREAHREAEAEGGRSTGKNGTESEFRRLYVKDSALVFRGREGRRIFARRIV